jgi:hypothetical protein
MDKMTTAKNNPLAKDTCQNCMFVKPYEIIERQGEHDRVCLHVCLNQKSDHYTHLILGEHPACVFFKDK